jgi:hypothetical protein
MMMHRPYILADFLFFNAAASAQLYTPRALLNKLNRCISVFHHHKVCGWRRGNLFVTEPNRH